MFKYFFRLFFSDPKEKTETKSDDKQYFPMKIKIVVKEIGTCFVCLSFFFFNQIFWWVTGIWVFILQNSTRMNRKINSSYHGQLNKCFSRESKIKAFSAFLRHNVRSTWLIRHTNTHLLIFWFFFCWLNAKHQIKLYINLKKTKKKKWKPYKNNAEKKTY